MLEAGVRMWLSYPQLLSVFLPPHDGANVSTDNPISEQEKQKWLAEMDVSSSPLLPSCDMWRDIVSEGLAGAYRRRTFDYENLFSECLPIAESPNDAWSRRNVER